MRRGRVVALAAIVPLALGAAWLSAAAPVDAWLATEPVVVGAVDAQRPIPVGDGALVVESARTVPSTHPDAELADAPSASQVVLVAVAMEGVDDPELACSLRLEATAGERSATWRSDLGSSTATSCYAEDGRVEGEVGFVLPEGALSDVRVLVVVDGSWSGVALDEVASAP